MELREVFEPLVNFLKNFQKKDKDTSSKDKAKERLQLVLMQDRASVSPDFFEMMKKEIIEVIKKYIEIDEESLEVQLTRGFEDGEGTGPALFANIPIKNIKPVAKKIEEKEDEDLVTEIVDNGEIIEEIESDEKGNIEEIENNSDVEKSTENIEIVNTENNATNAEQNTEKIVVEKTVKDTVEEKAEEHENDVETIETSKIEETVKEKIAEVKEGVTETIEKVKKGAKDGIKKIKTKTQKKKINE